MKKTICSLVLTILVCGASYAQESNYFSFGLHGGMPVGDFGDSYTSNFGVDVGYLHLISKESAKKKLYLGGSVTYTNYMGDELSEAGLVTEVEDAQFLALTFSKRLSPHKRILIGGDIGYAIGLNDIDGGFYGSPRIYYLFDSVKVYGGYRNIFTDGDALGSVQFGVVYMIKK